MAYKIRFKQLKGEMGESSVTFKTYTEAEDYIREIEYGVAMAYKHTRDCKTQGDELRHIVIFTSLEDLEAIFLTRV